LILTSDKLNQILGKGPLELVRENQRYTLKIDPVPPCTVSCPAGVNVKGYINLISRKRYREALRVILESNPFPGICGRVCTHPCEASCALEELEGAYRGIAIKDLKRFAADQELSLRGLVVEKRPVLYDDRIAVIGAGPAGLTAASDLADMGYSVTVFEKEDRPGGMLNQCIPRYRLPEDIVEFEIESIRRKGVNIVTSRKIEDIDSLFHEGFSAVAIATGAGKDREPRIESANKKGILGALEFLFDINKDICVELGRQVLVIGGGSSAFDAARTAKRCGAQEVTIVYRRSQEEMPANREEIQQALREGIKIRTLAVPVKVEGDEQVSGMTFLKARLGERDEVGRKRFIPIENSEFTLPADNIIFAIGSVPEPFDFGQELVITKWGTIDAGDAGRTPREKVFACGDAVTGPSTVVDVIGSGHRLANSVHRTLRNIAGEERQDRGGIAVVKPSEMDTGERAAPEHISSQEWTGNYLEVELGYPEHLAVGEALRCAGCGSCLECDTCVSSCDGGVLYGAMDGHSFLLKAPGELRAEVLQGKTDWAVMNSEGEKALELMSLVPRVDGNSCIACGRCEETCPYNAVQIVLSMDSKTQAAINLDICRSCGECQAVCPSGALDQGPFSNSAVQDMIGNTIGKIGDKPLIFASYWTMNGGTFRDDIVELMGTRNLSAFLFIEALAQGAGEISIVTSAPESGGDHYFPSGRNITDIVSRTKEVLEIIGIDPERIKVMNSMEEAESMDSYHPSLGSNPHPPSPKEAPLSRALAQLKWLTENPNLKLTENNKEGEEVKKQFAYWKAAGKLLEAEGFRALDRMMGSLEKLSASGSLEGEGAKIAKSGDRTITAALLISPEEPDHTGYGGRSSGEVLGSIPGIRTVDIEMGSSGPDLLRFSKRTRDEISEYERIAGEQGASLILTSTPYAAIYMDICKYRGSWQTGGIPVTDVYTLLHDHLREEKGVEQ